MNRIVLGTVQLGRSYGRHAGAALMPREQAFAVLDRAWALGIRAFDTAEAYGESIDRLSAWMDARGVRAEAHVVTKARMDDPAGIPGRVERALDGLSDVATLTLLSHGRVEGESWRRLAAAARTVGAVAGQSVYDAEEVRLVAAIPEVRRIQAPGNIFDRAALDARGSALIPLDLRSVYLQGVLLETEAEAERRVPGAGVIARAVDRAAADVGHDASSLLVATMLQALAAGDRLVIGVDRPGELDTLTRARAVGPEVIEHFARLVFAPIRAPLSERLLDPRRWPNASSR